MGRTGLSQRIAFLEYTFQDDQPRLYRTVQRPYGHPVKAWIVQSKCLR